MKDQKTAAGQRYCYNCNDPVPTASRCPLCKSPAFYRKSSPHSQSLALAAASLRPTAGEEEPGTPLPVRPAGRSARVFQPSMLNMIPCPADVARLSMRNKARAK